MIAAHEGHLKIVEILITLKANVNHQNKVKPHITVIIRGTLTDSFYKVTRNMYCPLLTVCM